MYFPHRGCVRTLRTLYVYATGDHLTHGTTMTVASSNDEYDGLNALVVAPVILPTKPRGLHNTGRTTSCCDRSVRIRRSVNTLMGHGRVSASDLISVTEYHAFFDGKVADVRATTADATPRRRTHQHLLTAHCPLTFSHHFCVTCLTRLYSKLLERLVARQLLDYLNAHHLLRDC